MITGDVNVRLSVSGAVQLPKASAACGLTEEVKQALLTVARKVAYIDENGQTYYDALYNALYPPAVLASITASFAQGSHVVYDTDTLESLKPYLTVTGIYDDGSSRAITSYTLSGTLTEGTSTITVTAGCKTATFTVSVTHKVAQVTGITAVFTQGSAVIYDNASLDDLKPYLVVTASYDDGTSAAVSSYTLSGTLAAGTSTITVSYGGFSDTFTVTVTERPATLISITAVFTQGQNVIYDTDSLDTLKPYLVVTAHYDDNTDAVMSDYTLSGTLAEGTSTITVSYGGKTTTFTVTVSHKPNTTAQIAESGKILTHRTSAPYYRSETATNGCVTIRYPMGTKTNILYPAGIIPTKDAASMFSEETGASAAASLFVYDENGEPVGFVNELTIASFNRWVQKADTEMAEFSQSWTLENGQLYYSGIAFSLDSRYLDDAYMYDKATGQVWFAGVNTPYYGESNAYGTLESITAVFNPGQNAIYDTDTLDSLRQYLTVTAHHAGNVDRTVTAYLLSGDISRVGTRTVTVEFDGKTTSFTVTVVQKALPSGYTKADYVESANTASSGPFVNTGVTATNNGDLVVDVGMMLITAVSANAYFVGASQTGAANSIGFGVGLTSNGTVLTAFNGANASVSPKDGAALVGEYIEASATFNTAGASITDGEHSVTTAGSGRQYSERPIYLFGIKSRNAETLQFPAPGRIYYLKVRENNDTILSLIPCTRNSDSAAGFYDLVNDNFITASGLTAGVSA